MIHVLVVEIFCCRFGLHGAYVWVVGLEEQHVVAIRCMNYLVLSIDL